MNILRRPWLPFLLLFLALAALLSAGAAIQRRAYETRGLEPGLPESIAHGGVRLGLNVSLQQYDMAELDNALQQISELGVAGVKQTFYWEQPFDWEAADRIVSTVPAHGLELVVQLDGNPQDNFAPPADPAQFAQWAAEFAARYGEQLRYYIIWDEPNLTTHWGNQPVNPYEYAALLSATAAAIRTADADAVIVAAPLAPTVETGPLNLADPLYLENLYEAGAADAFDVVAGKPYGFHSGPDDRTVDQDTLNFSRVILLREVMRRHGDQDAALFAGNWGWNSLPAGWQGAPSIWGQVDAETQADYTIAALERARREWPWMGYMFLENWDPDVDASDPRRGFDVANRPAAQALAAHAPASDVAFPGFHLAQEASPAQQFDGGWRFSPEYGADISETGDTVTFHFWGTDVGLRVRRADYRARFYVTVDGQEVNALPHDGNGTALVLTSPASDEDYLSTELVARNLSPGPHTLTVTAYRGWDQWALNGFSVGYRPPATNYRLTIFALSLLGVLFLLMALYSARRVAWGPVGQRWQAIYERSSEQTRLLVTVLAAGLVALTGWLTWGEQAAGLYRRLGDAGQLAATAAAASLFYVTPYFFLYLAALIILFFLIYARPAWGLALIAFSFPFYVVPKPMLGYRFSPVEIFTLLSAAAFIASRLSSLVASVKTTMKEQGSSRLQATRHTLACYGQGLRSWPIRADAAVLALVAVATFSLFFTERLDVASNEWRTVIIEPALFYFLFRALRSSRDELWAILDAFVLGGLTVALYGLWQFAQGENVITVAGGVSRLRSVYGSPNNVALYLGRIFPFLFAMLLAGQATPRRRMAYTLFLVPVAVTILLTLSKGALFLGIPVAAAVVFLLWLRQQGRSIWPWLLAGFIAVIVALALALNVPALSERLNLQGATSLQRLNLWRASLSMFIENPVTGVGLDNFLYEYRGRYILDAAWEEPDLNHPHNILLDFATRLGLLGLLAGAWLFWELVQRLRRLPSTVSEPWKPVAFGLAGALAQTVAHGLVDHSFFLVDLAFTFYLLLATAIWLQKPES